MKKKYFIALILLFLSVICMQKTSVSASQEISALGADNDEFSTAQEIGVNTGVSGKIEARDGKHYYKFTLEKAGYIQLNFRHDPIDSDQWFWRIRLYNDEFEELALRTSTGKGVNLYFPKIGLSAGIYYIKINDYYWSDVPYFFTVNYTVMSNWETETNDSFQKADNIAIGSVIHGSIMESNDADYYKFTLPRAGYVQVNFSHEPVDSGSNIWEIYFYNSQYEELAWRPSVGIGISQSMPKVGLSAGTYYIRIRDRDRWSDVPYSVKINYAASPNWEIEWNDSFTTADTLSLGSISNGSIMESDDMDYFKFTLPKTGYVQINFSHEPVDSEARLWNIQFYNGQYEELFSRLSTGTEVNQSLPKIGLPAGTFYIKLRRWDGWSDVPYSVKVNYATSSNWETEWNNSFTTADPLSLGATVNGSIMESDDADYYKITLPSRKKLYITFQHNAVNSTNSCWEVWVYNQNYQEITKTECQGNKRTVTLDAGSLSKGIYYIKVKSAYSYYSTMPYAMKAGTSIPISKPEQVKLKKLSSPASRQAKLVWKKVKGANGYEIFRAASKNGKYKKVTAIKSGGKVSYTAKKLKGRKKYYFKIRAYKVSGRKKIYGNFSKAQGVKIKR